MHAGRTGAAGFAAAALGHGRWRRARREEGDDRWVPPVSESGGRARLSAARARGRPMGRGGREREGGTGPSRPKKGKGEGEKTFRDFSFYKTLLTLFISFQLLFVL